MAALGRKESKTVRMVSTPTAKLMLHVIRSLQLRQARGAFVAGERKLSLTNIFGWSKAQERRGWRGCGRGKKKSFLFKNKLWIGKIPLLVVVVVIVVVYLKRRQSICF